MNRVYRRLQANHGTEAPSSIISFDCETKQEARSKSGKTIAQVFWFGCAEYFRLEKGKKTRVDKLTFHKPRDFWEFVESKQQLRIPLWVFAHNLHFDLTVSGFFDELESGRFSLGPIYPSPSEKRVRGKKEWKGFSCVRSSPYFWKLMGTRGRVNFVDTYNYCPSSLRSIGESLDCPKLEFPSYDDPFSKWEVYCQNDVEIVSRLIESLIRAWKESDCGVWQMSAASAAMHAFRHYKNPKTKKIESPDLIFAEDRVWDNAEREGYFGGYTGAFFSGIIHPSKARPDVETQDNTPYTERPVYGPVYSVDVRSLYPAMMESQLFPRCRLHRVENMPLREFVTRSSQGCAMAKVLINSWKEEFPVRHNEHLIYATGRYETVLCGPELLRAIHTNSIEKVIWSQFYSLSRLFRPFVQKFWTMRQEAERDGKGYLSLFAKMILNSLSGKFGQKAGQFKRVDNVPCEVDWGEWLEVGRTKDGRPTGESFTVPKGKRSRQKDTDYSQTLLFRGIAGITHLWEETHLPYHSFPAISAFITAYGREMLREARHDLPAGSVLYQATDALLITQEGFNALKRKKWLNPTELGYFALKDKADFGEICGTNWYRLGEDTKRSGLWGRAKEGEDGKTYAESWETCETHLLSPPKPEILVTRHELTTSDPKPKMIYNPQGWGNFFELIPTPEPFQHTESKKEKETRKRKERG